MGEGFRWANCCWIYHAHSVLQCFAGKLDDSRQNQLFPREDTHAACCSQLEQYSHMNNLIVSRLGTRQISYARAVYQQWVEPNEPKLDSLEQQLTASFSSKGAKKKVHDNLFCEHK